MSGEPRTAAPYSTVPRVAVSSNGQFADAVAAKDQLWGHTAVGTADDGRPGRLVRGDSAPLLREVDRAEFRMAGNQTSILAAASPQRWSSP